MKRHGTNTILRVAAVAICAAVGIAALAQQPAPPAEQKPAPERRAADTKRGDDRFMAGSSLRVPQVAGDALAMGATVDVDGPVNGDAVIAGGTVRINGTIGDTLYAAGGQVQVDSTVGGNARLAGGRVEIGPRGNVAGGATIGAGDVRIIGAVRGYLQVAAGSVLIDGPVGGDVFVTAGDLRLGPEARISGSLRYATSSELSRDAAAQVAGGVERITRDRPRASQPAKKKSSSYAGTFIWIGGLMLIAALLVLALPAFTSRVTTTLRERPGQSVMIGFVVLVCVPVAVIVLFLTLIGIPLALLALLAYFVVLLAGYVMAAVGVGDWVLARARRDQAASRRWRLAAAVLGVLAIALLTWIPYLGGVVAFAALIAGIGAISLQMRRRGAEAA